MQIFSVAPQKYSNKYIKETLSKTFDLQTTQRTSLTLLHHSYHQGNPSPKYSYLISPHPKNLKCKVSNSIVVLLS